MLKQTNLSKMLKENSPESSQNSEQKQQMFYKNGYVYKSLVDINPYQQVSHVEQIWTQITKNVLQQFLQAVLKKKIIQTQDDYQSTNHLIQNKRDIIKRGDKMITWIKHNWTERQSIVEYEKQFNQVKLMQNEKCICKILNKVLKIAENLQKQTINIIKKEIYNNLPKTSNKKSQLQQAKINEIYQQYQRHYTKIQTRYHQLQSEISEWRYPKLINETGNFIVVEADNMYRQQDE